MTHGHEVHLSWLRQDAGQEIGPGDTVLGWLQRHAPAGLEIEQIRDAMGKMLFKGDDAGKPTDGLSGGERVRLQMCRLMMERPNVLVLDEPTVTSTSRPSPGSP